MSGPPYPPPLGAGSNAIGEFVIGVSPIGDIPPFNPWLTIISQYANSPRLDGMILAFNAAMDQTQNIDNFFDMMWNIDTAQGYGLDVWGRIVGVSRTLELQGDSFFGFDEAAGPQTFGFNQAPFYSGATVTDNYVLQDSDFRTLILAKAFANICDGSIQSYNQLILSLFPGAGTCYVADNQNMTITWTFDFPLSPIQQAIVENSGVLPRPNGVSVSYSYP